MERDSIRGSTLGLNSPGKRRRVDGCVSRRGLAGTFIPFDRERVPVCPLEGETLVVTHIPKTGGTTFDWILRAAATMRNQTRLRVAGAVERRGAAQSEALGNWLGADRAELARADVVTGHLPFGVHVVLGRPCRYVALVREPIARSISQHLMGSRESLWSIDTAPAALLERGVIADNLQTRLLAGNRDFTEPCDDRMLERAIENVRTRYDFVGTTETFDRFLADVGCWLNWPAVFYQRQQVGKAGVDDGRRGELASDYRELNLFDRILYQNVIRIQEALRESRFRTDRPRRELPSETVFVCRDFEIGGRQVGWCAADEFQTVLAALRRGGVSIATFGGDGGERENRRTVVRE